MAANLVTEILRRFKMLGLADHLYYQITRRRNSSKNRQFKNAHPGFALPPDDLLYETYRLDYQHYHDDGIRTATWVKKHLVDHIIGSGSILEWGVGPARIIRHLPDVMPGYVFHGTDYNARIIQWCRQHISNCTFHVNAGDPPLLFGDKSFVAVYALSVFTHLSLESHELWMKEIHRVLVKDGLFLFTTQGDGFAAKLSKSEAAVYHRNQLVTRSEGKEGHRLYSAFQPPAFMAGLLGGDWEILTFLPGVRGAQDTWLVKKNG